MSDLVEKINSVLGLGRKPQEKKKPELDFLTKDYIDLIKKEEEAKRILDSLPKIPNSKEGAEKRINALKDLSEIQKYIRDNANDYKPRPKDTNSFLSGYSGGIFKNLPNQKQDAERTLSEEEIKKSWDKWDKLYESNIKGTNLVRPHIEDPREIRGPLFKGVKMPAVYTDKSFSSNSDYNLDPRSNKEVLESFATRYLNKIRPKGLDITLAEDNQSRAYPVTEGGNPSIIMSEGDSSDPSVFVHELTHAMQYMPSDVNHYTTDDVAKYELPAVLAGDAISAMKAFELQKAGLVDFSSKKGLGFPGFKQFSIPATAISASQYMFGEDPFTKARTSNARHMTELLSTREGLQFLKMLNTPKSKQ
jgi:hypothetical protein